MTQDREPECNTPDVASDPRPGLKRRKWLIAVMVLFGAATWVMYLPAEFYNPYCNPEHRYKLGEYYGPHLSTYYRDALIDNLTIRGIPHVEIGDRVLVPFADNGYEVNPIDPLGRFLRILIDPHDIIWSQTNAKIASWSLQAYIKHHYE